MRKVFVILASLMLSACTQYKYNNVSYESRDAAYSAAWTDVQSKINAVPDMGTKVGKSVLVVVPPRDVIQANGVRVTGNPSSEATGYIVDVLEMGFVTMADVVRKGGLFEQVEVSRSRNPEAEQFAGYDYKLWLLGMNQEQWQWYLTKAGAEGREAISVDRGLSGAARLISFNSGILKGAQALNGPRAEAPKPRY